MENKNSLSDEIIEIEGIRIESEGECFKKILPVVYVREKVMELLKDIDMIDLKVFFSKIKIEETGERIEIPKELFDILMQYWRYIEQDLVEKIKNRFGESLTRSYDGNQ